MKLEACKRTQAENNEMITLLLMLFFSDKRKTDQIIHELDGNRRMADRITQRVFSSEEHLGAEVTILITCLFLERMRCLGDILYLLYIFLSVCLVMDSSSRPGPL